MPEGQVKLLAWVGVGLERARCAEQTHRQAGRKHPLHGGFASLARGAGAGPGEGNHHRATSAGR